MATFPSRHELCPTAVNSILPQVDRLFLVLNQYEAMPDWARDEKITAVIPDRDLKDVGKFYFTPDPDDLVFFVDDDILYPADYVALTQARFAKLARSTSCVGYFGNALSPHEQPGRVKWKTFQFEQPLGRTVGASLLGTGTVCAWGRNVPPLDFMTDYIGICDMGFALWQMQTGCLTWVLPRDGGWMRNVLPAELEADSLYETVHKRGSSQQSRILRQLAEGWPHAGETFRNFMASPAADAYRVTT
ncbi:hypothetical protein ACEYYA_08600 [Paracoccus sp. p3-h83]